MVAAILAFISAILKAATSAQLVCDGIVLAVIGIGMFIACSGTVAILGIECLHKEIVKRSRMIFRKVTW
tara:strand:- start:206 stop:412 length:207 start_codon:yes stop_codon:yes gene_type:complete